jgi:hypothetical protein
LKKTKGVWNGDAEIVQNPLFWATFWGIFGIFIGRKGSPNGKYGKN